MNFKPILVSPFPHNFCEALSTFFRLLCKTLAVYLSYALLSETVVQNDIKFDRKMGNLKGGPYLQGGMKELVLSNVVSGLTSNSKGGGRLQKDRFFHGLILRTYSTEEKSEKNSRLRDLKVLRNSLHTDITLNKANNSI